MGYNSTVSEVSGLEYIHLKDGMLIVETSGPLRESLGKGIVISDNDESTIIWENGEVYYNIPNNIEWVIFKTVGQLTDKELLVAKLKYSDKME
jgi:hypothetical protein